MNMSMNKEIKAEICGLEKQRRAAAGEHKAAWRTENKTISQCRRRMRLSELATLRQFDRIDRRIAILEGRVS